MNITDEIGRKIKTLFAYFTDKCYRFHGPVYIYSKGRRAGFFRLLQMEWRKKKRRKLFGHAIMIKTFGNERRRFYYVEI